MPERSLVGYYDSALQTKPVYDPGLDVICLSCGKALEEPVKTISVSAVDSDRSLFYRVHKHCFDNATEEQQLNWDSVVLENPDGVYAAVDPPN